MTASAAVLPNPGAATLTAALAVLPATLLAYNTSPSPTFLNQALAFAGWGLWLVVAAPALRALGAGAWALLVALALMALAALGSMAHIGWGALPATLGLSALATLAAAAALVAAGACTPRARGEPLFAAMAWALLACGVANVAIAVVQVFAPELPDGDWVAISGIAGRAVGNLRQPNHLSSLLLWACIAAVALAELRRLSLAWAAALVAAFVFGVVLTASRTGLVSVGLLALWGLLDRRLSGRTRLVLLATPLVYGLSWWLMGQWAAAAQASFGGTARLAETDISGSRFGIWANTLALIRQHPWLGVGWGEFNIAWSLTPFPGRPVAFFDHTHNLPLQLAVEMGLPLAALVMGLLLAALGLGAAGAWRAAGDAGTAQRTAWMAVLMIGLHSLLEYPLWYAYFLLPAAWLFGVALRPAPPAAEPAPGAEATAAASGPGPGLVVRAAGLALMLGAAFAVWDYQRVAEIFVSRPGAPSLERRIEAGRHSLFFGHHADYAAVTSQVAVGDPARAFDRASHYLLDTRFMIAWSTALAEQGRLAEALHLAARLREFRKPEAETFFAPCAPAASAPAPAFPCQAPASPLPWQAFLPR